MRRGVAYASCGHAFHPICLLEYEKHAGNRTADNTMKCPLCRQPYTVKHFIPDDNLRSLCLEHTLHEAIVVAESAAKEADDKAKEAGLARAQAAAAAQQAMQLRQQAGQAFCSPKMGARLTALMHQTANAPNVLPPQSPQAPLGAGASPSVPAGARPRPSMMNAPVSRTGRPAAPFMAVPGLARAPSGLEGGRRMHNTPAAVAAAAVAPPAPAPDPGPGFDLGVLVQRHMHTQAQALTSVCMCRCTSRLPRCASATMLRRCTQQRSTQRWFWVLRSQRHRQLRYLTAWHSWQQSTASAAICSSSCMLAAVTLLVQLCANRHAGTAKHAIRRSRARCKSRGAAQSQVAFAAADLVK